MPNYPFRSDDEIARDAARLIAKTQELGMRLDEDEIAEIITRAIGEANLLPGMSIV